MLNLSNDKLNKVDKLVIMMRLSNCDDDRVLCSVADELDEEIYKVLKKKDLSVNDIDDMVQLTQYAEGRWGTNAGDLIIKLHQNYVLKKTLGLYRDR